MIAPKLPKNEKKRLDALNNYQILNTEFEEQFDIITQLAAQICETSMAVISFVDQDKQWFKSSYGLAARETSREVSFCGHTILEKESLIVENAHLDIRFKDNPLVTGNPNIAFYAGNNLTDTEGFNLGTLCVLHTESKILTNNQKESLKLLAKQVVNLLDFRKKELNHYFNDLIFSSSDEGIAIYNKGFVPIHCNVASYKMLGLTYRQFIGRDLYNPEWKTVDEFGRELSASNFPVVKTLQDNKKVKDFIMGISVPNKPIKWINVSSFPIEKNNEQYAVVSFIDIDDKVELIRQNKYLNIAIGALDEGVVIQDESAKIIQCNAAATQILGLSKDQLEGKTSLDPDWNSIKEDGSDFPGSEHPAVVTLKTGKSFKEVIMGVRYGNKNKVWISINSSPVYLEKNNKKKLPDAVICTFRNITTHHIQQNRIKLLYNAFSQLKNGIVITNPKGVIEFANKYFLQSKKYSSAELIGKNVNVLKSGLQTPEYYKVLWETLNNGEVFESKIQNKRKDGEIILESVSINPIFNADKEIINYLAVYNDLDEQAARELLVRDLEDKELLLKEIHHRVKNNLQIVSSLLSLQIMQLKDTQSENALRDAQQRINSIALIHEKLYQNKSVNKISAKEYLVDLAKNILSNLAQDHRITIDYNMDDVELVFDKLIPCGLILNEILINIIKYAFNLEGGKVKISFVQKESNYLFSIEDNGIGLESSDVILKSKTLGSKLIVMLTKQLKGTLKLDTSLNKGLKYTIIFPI